MAEGGQRSDDVLNWSLRLPPPRNRVFLFTTDQGVSSVAVSRAGEEKTQTCQVPPTKCLMPNPVAFRMFFLTLSKVPPQFTHHAKNGDLIPKEENTVQ